MFLLFVIFILIYSDLTIAQFILEKLKLLGNLSRHSFIYIELICCMKENNNLLDKSCHNAQESENDSDKTKDTTFHVTTHSVFKSAQEICKNIMTCLKESVKILIKLFESTSNSDKIVRLTGSIIKFLKNFQLLAKPHFFDKFSTQITQLRRLLRVNRMLVIIKDYIGFFKKQRRTKRDYYEVFLKTVMLFCDINDSLLYLMQHQVLKQRGMATLKKNVTNFYFFQCVIWTLQHIYDYFTKQHKTDQQKKTRRINIAKYIMDTVVSHNDFSAKQFSIQTKDSTILGLVSSIMGLALVWK